jgi:hypothetical protein
LKSITNIRTTYLTAQDRNTPTIELTLCLSRVYSFTQSKTPLAYLFSYLNLFINSRNKWVQWAVQLYARKTLVNIKVSIQNNKTNEKLIL